MSAVRQVLPGNGQPAGWRNVVVGTVKVLEYALERGFKIANDITGLESDEYAKIAAKYSADVIIMHKKGSPKDMQKNPFYENVVLEVDIPAVSNIKFNTIRKFKKLIEYICTSHPFKPNMQELLSKIDMPRTAYSEVYYYLELLQKAKVLRLIKSADKKDAILTKPEKIYLNNTNLHFCYCDTQEIGSIREVFFVSMFDCFKIYAPKKGDFVVNGYIFEIGGKNKTKKQIKEIENSFVVRDDMEIGSNRIIPLWLFGFLY